MKLYNSKTNQLETFVPMEPGKISMYVCGPTVYNYAHIGNARPLVVFDVLRRVFEAQGYQVDYVSNYTDIDDRIIAGAEAENISEEALATRYIQAYEDLKTALHVTGVQANPKVTETIPEIIDFIVALIQADVAYESAGDVYFRVHKVASYGSLSHQDIAALIAGARIEKNEHKENPLDFTLWKHTEVGLRWDSPWGKGRPGWHTECVVMIHQHFHQHTIDIHAGGTDLRFPHHENEEAQNEALYHQELAHYWLHNAMLNVDGVKMSKSLGNIQWAQDYVDVLGANVTRWLLLSAHYRLVLNISDILIAQSQKEIQKLEDVLKQADVTLALADASMSDTIESETMGQFLAALQDDLNIANANVILFEVVKNLNQILRQKTPPLQEVSLWSQTVRQMLALLGIVIEPILLSAEDKKLFSDWQHAQNERDFTQADALRQRLMKRGLI